MPGDDSVYIEIETVQQFSQQFETAGQLLTQIDQVLEVAIDFLCSTALLGLIGASAMEAYLEGIQPKVRSLAARCDQMKQSVNAAVAAYQESDASAARLFQSTGGGAGLASARMEGVSYKMDAASAQFKFDKYMKQDAAGIKLNPADDKDSSVYIKGEAAAVDQKWAGAANPAAGEGVTYKLGDASAQGKLGKFFKLDDAGIKLNPADGKYSSVYVKGEAAAGDQKMAGVSNSAAGEGVLYKLGDARNIEFKEGRNIEFKLEKLGVDEKLGRAGSADSIEAKMAAGKYGQSNPGENVQFKYDSANAASFKYVKLSPEGKDAENSASGGKAG